MKRTRKEYSPDGCDASPAGEVMSGLLKEIEGVDQEAAATLREADICTDAEIQCLSREELNGLFPGAENLKLRRKIFDIILQKKPTNDVLKEMRNLVPEESLRSALTGGGILVDYLCLVKDIKTQVNNVTTFFDVQIDLLEEGSKARSLQEPATDKHLKTSKSQTSISDYLQQSQAVFLKKIRERDQEAASVLQREDLITDADIQSLTQKDLDDLLPEPKHFRLKRILHQQKLIDIVLKDLRGFIPLESLNAALTGDGVLVQYKRLLQDNMNKVDNVQNFLKAHLDLLEDISKAQPHQQPATGSVRKTSDNSEQEKPQQNPNYMKKNPQQVPGSDSKTSDGSPQEAQGSVTKTSDNSEQVKPQQNLNYMKKNPQQVPVCSESDSSGSSDSFEAIEAEKQKGSVQKPSYTDEQEKPRHKPTGKSACSQEDSSTGVKQSFMKAPSLASRVKSFFTVTVIYKMVVSGRTFDAHQELLNKVKGLCGDTVLDLINWDENTSVQDSQITFVFCPIVSRVGTDVEAALREVPGKGKVILVLMRYTYEAKHVTTLKTWNSNHDVVLCVNVFYFEKKGLLKCSENDKAIREIQEELLKHSIKTP